MIVTTGGRRTRSVSASSKTSGSSSESDCVAVRIWPRFIRILISSGIGTPSACEKSRTVTPDWTVTGPVGATTSRGCFGGPTSWRPRPWRPGGPGRLAPWSMTTRRLPARPAPPRGLMGLFGLGAMDLPVSVEATERRIDLQGLLDHAVEAAARRRPLEAEQPPAGVDAAPWHRPARRQHAVHGPEPLQLRLGSLAPAAGTGADRRRAGHAAEALPSSGSAAAYCSAAAGSAGFSSDCSATGSPSAAGPAAAEQYA